MADARFLVVFGTATPPARLAPGLRGDAPTRFGVYQLVLFTLNALVVVVVARLRALRRR